MKVKADKKAKQANPKLHKIKQSKNDIAKSKEKKSGPTASAAATAHSFAVKKVLAVKKKNNKQGIEDVVQTNIQKVPKKNKFQKQKEVKVLEQPAENKKIVEKSKKTVSEHQLPVHDGKKSEKSKKKNKETKPNDVKHTEEEENDLPKVLASRKIIISALKACKKTIDSGYEKKNLFGDDLKYALQISSVKIPDVPSRNCRIQLPNAIYKKGDDICLIVKDLARGRKQDHEETLLHWQDKLRQLGVDFISQIIPLQQLKQEYRQYEMKNKLANRFDRFLVDARINGHVFNFLGNAFIKRCKNPTSVILDKDEKITKNLNKVLGRITYKQTNTGRITEIQFATHKMPMEAAVENAEALMMSLKSQFPGGWLNIRTINLKPMTDIPVTFPLYVSKVDPNLVPVPKISGPRERFEKANSEKLLQITKNKYQFQAGNLVRVPFEQRKILNINRQDVPKDDEAEKNGEIVGEHSREDESDDDEEMELPRERASDTEQSDLDDDDD
ncbi:ribosomal L1 domain-containing protein CG13096 [Toxorhynchites rutilus septentrionalis]|uniref:ribosomal L1 domain-containing protein CG13096 n=1 Tax=Toxorhynchites rutilus septentrionalis TaxID=329112 RepID=UPI00247AD97E|nr:ribosomal L1 domain-containing protein CG13096 [Toxorhynchites rutilus septentrionalis]